MRNDCAKPKQTDRRSICPTTSHAAEARRTPCAYAFEDAKAARALGSIPITIDGFEGSLENTVVRMTVSSAGFSDGQLGGTIDEGFAWVITLALGGPGSSYDGTAFPLDINASTPPTQDTSVWCNALSATFVIGGIAQ